MNQDENLPNPDAPFDPVDADRDSFPLGRSLGHGSARSKRRAAGGLIAAGLGLLIPVAMGGVTVLGTWFWLLEPLLNKPRPAAQEPAASPPSTGKDSRGNPTPLPPPQPTFAAPEGQEDSADRAEAEPLKTAETNPVEREEAAENALGLAKRMQNLKPSAAEDWYQRVVEKYPETQAAQIARDWLKRRRGEP